MASETRSALQRDEATIPQAFDSHVPAGRFSSGDEEHDRTRQERLERDPSHNSVRCAHSQSQVDLSRPKGFDEARRRPLENANGKRRAGAEQPRDSPRDDLPSKRVPRTDAQFIVTGNGNTRGAIENAKAF